MALDTPVVVFFFNRPRHLERVFARVRAAQPRDLVLVADGPRSDRPGEAQACDEARKVVEAIDWDCNVTCIFAEQNMGCRDRIASGIREAFARYPSAIFLEDDCLPRPSFFAYCGELLDRYRDDPSVAFVSGTRFIRLPGPTGGASYQFCRMPLVWGWASWASAWQGYDEVMTDWPEHEGAIRNKLAQATKPLGPAVGERVVNSAMGALHNCYRGTLNTWDHPLAYHLLKHDKRCIIPRNNLVTNVGFGPLATHSVAIPTQASFTSQDIALPLDHPPCTAIDPQLDANVWKNTFCHPLLGEPLPARIAHAVRRSAQAFAFKHWGKG